MIPLLRLLVIGGLITFCISGCSAHAEGNRRMVLVAAADSDVPPLSPLNVRKLYLGVVFNAGNFPIQPFLNNSDSLLREVFLQNVIFMSQQGYERAIMLRMLRAAGIRPVAYENEKDLLAALHGHRNSVTYLWADRASTLTDLKVVAVLWEEKD